jgi:hypothetical protein
MEPGHCPRPGRSIGLLPIPGSRNASCEALRSRGLCTAIFTLPASSDLVGEIHKRMPVTPAPKDYNLWLDPTLRQAERLQPLPRPYPPQEMEVYPMSTRMNNPAHDRQGRADRAGSEGTPVGASERGFLDTVHGER